MLGRVLIIIVAVAVLAGGCTADEPKRPPRTSTSESIPAPPDSGLRPVTIPYGDGIAHVPRETAAQAICQAVSPPDARDLFGGDVGRSLADEGRPSCLVSNMLAEAHLSMAEIPIDEPGAKAETIAGYPARVKARETSGEATLELAPKVEGMWDHAFMPYLSITASTEYRVDIGKLLRGMLTTLAPKLVRDGPKTPVANEAGWIQYTPTPPIPNVPLSDLPMTVRALVACTAVVNSTVPKPRPDQVEVHVSGHCSWGEPESVLADLAMSGTTTLGHTEITVAGHPARLEDDTLTIELGVAVEQSWPIQLSLTRRGLAEAALLTWAEQVVTAIGTV